MSTITTDDGFHEIQLNGKQLVFLFMTVTVISVVIFLLGVMVGRGVRAERASSDQSVPEASAPPSTLAVVSAAGPGAPATSAEELSYPKRLANSEPTREQLRDTPPPAQPPPQPAMSAPAPPATVAATTAISPVATEPPGGGYAIQLAALGKREEAEAVARRLIGKKYPAYVMVPSAGAPSVFRVRVGKFKDRREAESMAARLQREEQFKPWIVP